MKLHVIVSDFGAAVHMGAHTDIFAKSFDLPDEIADYIRKKKGDFSTVSLALEDEAKDDGRG